MSFNLSPYIFFLLLAPVARIWHYYITTIYSYLIFMGFLRLGQPNFQLLGKFRSNFVMCFKTRSIEDVYHDVIIALLSS